MSDNHNNSENSFLIKKVTWAGIIVNFFLTILKAFVGYMGNSQAVIADAVHSLSDIITDFTVLAGVKYWEPPADDNHPYGHRRIETLVTLIIGFMLGYVGLRILFNAVIEIGDPPKTCVSIIALSGPFLSIILKEVLFRWTANIAKRVKSTALFANAWHHRSDSLSSIPAFIAVAVAAYYPEFYYIDQIGALIVSLFILRVSWSIVKPAFRELIDEGASRIEKERFYNIVMSVPGVRSAHKIRTRRSGGGYFIDLHVLVDGDLSVREGHEIAAKVKYDLIYHGTDVIDVVVHTEPFFKNLISEGDKSDI